MTNTVKSAYHFFWPNILLFKIAGIWSPFYYDDGSIYKTIYKWYTRVVLTLCIGYIIQSIVELVRRYEEVSIDEKSEFYSYVAQLIVGLIKIYFLARNEDRMRKMFQEIEEPPFHRNNDYFFSAKLNERIRTNLKIMLLFWIPIYTTIAMKLFKTAADSKHNQEMFQIMCVGGMGSENGTEFHPHPDFDCTYPKLVMPWLTWFPFPTDKSPGHQIGISYQLLILTIFASYIFNFDMYISSWMMYISFQFELIGHDLETIRSTSEEQVLRTTKSLKDELVVTQEMIKGIRKIIFLHNDVLRLFHHTQDSLCEILLVQYFWISILICMLLIQMSMNHPLSPPFISAAGYLYVAILQIFVVFYHSNEVKLQSLKIATAAFYSGWHESGQFSPLLRPYILFLIRCTNKELRVLAGNIFDVNMVAFLKVLKASYSYFALVSSGHKKQG